MTDNTEVAAKSQGVEMFSFGDPVPVLDGRGIMDFIECYQMNDWYEPPISPAGLAKAFRSAVHHESAINFKVNVLTSCFKPNKLFKRQQFRQLALDYLVMGNCYLEDVVNVRHRTKHYRPSLAKYTRRDINLTDFWFVQSFIDPHKFENDVYHIFEADIDQEIYGVPQYMSALQSAFLNENATLFRRKYYLNGSHAGFIMYLTDPANDEADIDGMRKALKESKGPGNFRNLFLYAPNGKKDGLQIIPISEVAAKDEFWKIKEVTRDDMLASHRVYPQLMGIVPQNSGGFGSIIQAAQVFDRNELQPVMLALGDLNELTGDSIIEFNPYTLEMAEDMARSAASTDA